MTQNDLKIKDKLIKINKRKLMNLKYIFSYFIKNFFSMTIEHVWEF